MFRFTLKQLQIFLAIAEFENVSKASENLMMSQSAVSSALLELERAYDVQFFDRFGKKLSLNETGKSFREQAQALIDQTFALDRLLKQGKSCESIHLGATVTVGDYLAPEMIEILVERYPHAKVRLAVSNTHQIIEQLLNFEIDVALMEGCQVHPDLVFLPWRHDQMVIFCAPSHPLALLNRPLSLSDLKNARWVLRETGSSTRQIFNQAMLATGTFVECQIEMGNSCSIKQMVQAGEFLSCISQDLLQVELSRGELIGLSTPFLDLKRQYYIAYHKKKILSSCLKDFITICSTEIN